MADTDHERNVQRHEHGSNEPPINPDLSIPENRHEHRDVNVFALGRFAIGLVIVTIFCVGIVAGIFQYLLNREGGAVLTRVGSPAQDARQLPPEPRLEETPALDLQSMREAEEKLQSTYGWLDESAGTVRLPIDRAMDLVVQRGLPVRSTPGIQSEAANVSVPTASGLGPIMQQTGGPLAPEIQKGGVVPEAGK
ncbi:MAG TPA: hypothetical protein VHW24_02795 [Bryobacteraceae bacterium]|jgi:hypothetical protein|nr:hypothetical protein [Bryobacteraceae bacterium]